jgi:hypothetical protein
VHIDSAADDNGVPGQALLDHALTAACLVAGAMEAPTLRDCFPTFNATDARKNREHIINKVAKIASQVTNHAIYSNNIIGPNIKVRELNG